MSSRHNRERRVLTLILMIGILGIYVTYATIQPVAALQPTVTYSFSKRAKPVALNWPSYGAGAVGAVDYGVLETHGATDPIPTASTIKVLTALVVLQQKPLRPGEPGPTLTITQDDIDSYQHFVSLDGSVVNVELGEQLSEYDALEALLLPSANNIAETLARWAFGSIDTFNAFANQYAKQLGMSATTVTDPSGLAPSTVSTPHDLVLLGEAAITNPVVAEIAAKPSADIPVQGTVSNVNFLVGHNGIVGLKTGNNDQDPGAFLLASRQRIGSQDITIITAVMDGPNLWAAVHDSLALLDSTTAGFTPVQLATGTPVAAYRSPWQTAAKVATASAQTVAIWNGSSVSTLISLPPLRVPTGANTQVGTLTFVSGGSSIASIPLILRSKMPGPDLAWQLSHPDPTMRS